MSYENLQSTHLTLNVPHQCLVEQLDAVGPEHLRQAPQLRGVGELLRVERDGTLAREGYEGSK